MKIMGQFLHLDGRRRCGFRHVRFRSHVQEAGRVLSLQHENVALTAT